MWTGEVVRHWFVTGPVPGYGSKPLKERPAYAKPRLPTGGERGRRRKQTARWSTVRSSCAIRVTDLGQMGSAPALSVLVAAVAPAASHSDDQPGTPDGRFQRAIHNRHVQNAEMAAREMGGVSLNNALLLCELLANANPSRYERAALRWLQRFIDERLLPLSEVALAASALAELRHGKRNVGLKTLESVLRR